MTKLDQKYPSVADLERRALRRIPRFASEYVRAGIGREVGLMRNRQALDAITFRPEYLPHRTMNRPQLGVSMLGRRYDLPFGITPFGLSDLIWPGAAKIAAAAAKKSNIPMGISSFATTRMAELAEIAPENTWYQYYPVNDPDMQSLMLSDIQKAGFRELIVTVDIPTETRRDRDLRVGLSVPPRLNAGTCFDVISHPAWALATLREGVPRFRNLLPYVPSGLSTADAARFLLDRMEGHVTLSMLAEIRSQWPGPLIVKGVMSGRDAERALSVGADGIWVSNHGGRQLDAARASVEVLPEVRAAIGKAVPLMVDSGPRTGLDIARMLALGADFVFLGRAFIWGIAALGPAGAAHVIHILKTELSSSMGQIGCEKIPELVRFLDQSTNIGSKRGHLTGSKG